MLHRNQDSLTQIFLYDDQNNQQSEELIEQENLYPCRDQFLRELSEKIQIPIIKEGCISKKCMAKYLLKAFLRSKNGKTSFNKYLRHQLRPKKYSLKLLKDFIQYSKDHVKDYSIIDFLRNKQLKIKRKYQQSVQLFTQELLSKFDEKYIVLQII